MSTEILCVLTRLPSDGPSQIHLSGPVRLGVPYDFGDSTQCLLWLLEPQAVCLCVASPKARQTPLSPCNPFHQHFTLSAGGPIIWGYALLPFAL